MSPRRPDSRRRRQRSSAPDRGPRRSGLWPLIGALGAILVVLVAVLAIRERDLSSHATNGLKDAAGAVDRIADAAGDVATETAGAAESEPTAADRRKARERAAKTRAAKARAAMRPTVANGLLCRPAANRPTLVRRRAGGSSKRVALTFDDGPSPYTVPILDELRKRKAKATFFVLGAAVKSRRSEITRIIRDGHALGNHTWSHTNVAAGGALAANQIMDTQAAIKAVVGEAGCLMRPPYGATGPGLVSWLKAHKKVGVMWDVDSNDYQRPGAEKMARAVVAATRPGSIILMHDGGGERTQTVAAVRKVLHRLQAKGYEFVTVPELLKLPGVQR